MTRISWFFDHREDRQIVVSLSTLETEVVEYGDASALAFVRADRAIGRQEWVIATCRHEWPCDCIARRRVLEVVLQGRLARGTS